MKAKYAIVLLAWLGSCFLTLPFYHGLRASNCGTDTSRVSTYENDTVRLVKSLKQLAALPKGTFVETCDLSDRNMKKELKDMPILNNSRTVRQWLSELEKLGIKNMPDLRTYKIKNLNLSGNYFWSHSIGVKEKLPKSLETLDMSNCKILTTAPRNKKGVSYVKISRRAFCFEKDSLPKLREIVLHDTELSSVRFPRNVEKADLRNCNLYQFMITGSCSKEALKLHYLDISHNWNMYSGIGIEAGEINGIKTLKRDSCAQGKELWEGIWL